MRTNLALSFASVVVLAFASGCSHNTIPAHDDTTSDPGPVPANTAAAAREIAAKTSAGNAVPTDPSTHTLVHGKLTESSVALDNARAVAVTSDQTTYSASLDTKGEFTLSLPVGVSYRIVFVNQLSGGGQVKIGQLAFKSGANISEWFGANAAGEVDVGDVTASGSAGSSASDHSDDPSCHMDDGRTIDGPKSDASASIDAINVCLIWPSVTLHTGVEIDAKWGDLEAKFHEELDTTTRDDDKSCANWSGATGAIMWGAPWSVAASGQVTVAGGVEINGGISGGFNGSAGFGWGFYGGYSYSYSYSSSFSFGGAYTGNLSSNISGSISENISVGAFVGGQVSGGWAISGSISGSITVDEKACVTAGSCATTSSCVANKCEQP